MKYTKEVRELIEAAQEARERWARIEVALTGVREELRSADQERMASVRRLGQLRAEIRLGDGEDAAALRDAEAQVRVCATRREELAQEEAALVARFGEAGCQVQSTCETLKRAAKRELAEAEMSERRSLRVFLEADLLPRLRRLAAVQLAVAPLVESRTSWFGDLDIPDPETHHRWIAYRHNLGGQYCGDAARGDESAQAAAAPLGDLRDLVRELERLSQRISAAVSDRG